MATAPFTLTPGIWQRITDKGQGGTLWIKSKAQFPVVIDHVGIPGVPEDSFAEGSPEEVAAGVSVKKSFTISDNDPLTIPADDSNDVYYALYRSVDSDKSAIAVVDVL